MAADRFSVVVSRASGIGFGSGIPMRDARQRRYRPVRSPVPRHLAPSLAFPSLIALLLGLAWAGPARAEKDLTVKLPTAGDYQVWLEAETASGPQAQAPERVTGDRASLPLPAPPTGLKEWRLLALDEKSGYAAAQTLP